MPYRDLWAKNNLAKRTAKIREYIRKYKPGVMEAARPLLGTLDSLQGALTYFYSSARDKKYRVMNGMEISQLQILYQQAVTAIDSIKSMVIPPDKKNTRNAVYFDETKRLLEGDKTITDRLDARDYLSLPAAVYKLDTELQKGDYADGQFKYPGFNEYSRIYATSGLTTDEVLQLFISKTPQEVKTEYENVIRENPHLYEYQSFQRIPPDIRNSGSRQVIDRYLQEQGDNLTFPEKMFLESHKRSIEKADQVREQGRQAMDAGQEIGPKLNFLHNGNDGVELDVHQPAIQTSGNGCWSCAAQLLLQGRGITNVTQEDIRAYRPVIPQGEQVIAGDQVDLNYQRDSSKSLMENADSFIQFAPNTMLHELEIEAHSLANEDDGYSSETYIDNAVNLLKKQINHAIRVDHSPVALLTPGHYITIVGIYGDNVKFKDSARGPGDPTPADHTFTRSLKEIVSENFFTDDGQHLSIQISWASDIKLAMDGKTIHGVPSEYVYLKDDGTLKEQPDEFKLLSGESELVRINRNGIRVCRPAGDENAFLAPKGFNYYGRDGVRKVERTYIPKNLNVPYLKRMKDARSAEDEAKLAADDKAIYNIRDGKKDAVNPELRRVLDNEIAMEARLVNEAYKPNLGEEPDPTGGQRRPEAEPVKKPDPKPVNEAKPEKEPKKEEAERRLGREGRPYVDDTELGGSKRAFTRVLKRERKKIVEQRESDAEERTVSAGLKTKFSFAKIRDTADELIGGLDAGMHWYLLGAKGEFKEMRTHLEQVRRLSRKGVSAITTRAESFTEQDARELRDALTKAGRAAKTYLLKKYGEMERDPRRRNDAGKAKYEQPRILAALNTYDSVLEITNSVRARSGEKGIIQAEADRVASVRHLRKELVSDSGNMRTLQDASVRNRVEVPEGNEAGLARIDALFGMGKKHLPEFASVKALENLTEVTARFSGIGSTSKAEQLTSKDFAAAASASVSYDTLRAVMANDAKKLEKEVPAINRAKTEATQAFTAYAAGNKTPLARLIANGINHLAEQGRREEPGIPAARLYQSEIGQRLLGMLDRDTELMEKAVSQGLKPASLKEIKNMELEGRYSCKADLWSKKGAKITGDAWSSKEKLERYTDLLMEAYLRDAEENAAAIRNAVPAYRNLVDQATATAEAAKDRLRTQFNRDALQTMKNFPEAKKIPYLTADEGSKIREQARNRINTYEAGVIKKHFSEILSAESQGKKKLNTKEKLRIALEAEEAEVRQNQNQRVQKNKNTVRLYNAYIHDKESFQQYNELCRDYERQMAEIEAGKERAIAAAKLRYIKPNGVHDMIAEPGQEIRMRNRIREYIRGTGFVELSPKRFLEQVYDTKGPNPLRKDPVIVDVVNYETSVAEKPVKNLDTDPVKLKAATDSNSLKSKRTSLGSGTRRGSFEKEVKKGFAPGK